MTHKPKSQQCFHPLVAFVLLSSWLAMTGCQGESDSELSVQEREEITEAIRQRLDWYREAVMRKDLEEYLDLWSASDEFLFAGDGRILGGYDDWVKLTTQHTAGTQKWLRWDYGDMHIVVLGRNAASCTTEIEMSWLNVDGVTLSLNVIWTYVFRKEGDTWRVIQTNGTHTEI